MIELRDKETGRPLGEISEAQFQFLSDHLERETDDDTDYYLNKDTMEMFVSQGIDSQLLDLLSKAMGDREDIEIEWIRK